MRRKKIYLSCKKPWELDNHCLGKGEIRCIEVTSNKDYNCEIDSSKDYDKVEESSHERVIEGGRTLATLSSVPQFLTIKVLGKVEGENIMVLIDDGISHNFIDESFMSKKRIKDEPFVSFNVATNKGNISLCTKLVK